MAKPKPFTMKATARKVKKDIHGKGNCCREVEEMYVYLEELRAWCNLVWDRLWGGSGGTPPPPPPSWP